MFRQTYRAARLQTLDQGRPVSVYTVAQELGHESGEMVRRVYAGLGKVRHRAETPEFRPDHWFEERDGLLVARRADSGGYHQGSGSLELGGSEAGIGTIFRHYCRSAGRKSLRVRSSVG
jgi:hypothetical protein